MAAHYLLGSLARSDRAFIGAAGHALDNSYDSCQLFSNSRFASYIVHSFFILTHLYSYFVIHFYPLKTVDQTVESLYFLNIFSQTSSLKMFNMFNPGYGPLIFLSCCRGIL